MNKSINIDDKSSSILNEVDEIHHDTMINYGIHLVSKTQVFKSLSSESNDEVDNEVIVDDTHPVDNDFTSELEATDEKMTHVVSESDTTAGQKVSISFVEEEF